jgi:hypothetical protein
MHVAVLKAYAIPSIASKVLASEASSSSSSNGLQASSGSTQNNLLGGMYKDLTNTEYVYLICLVVVEPVRWVTRYGYRPMTLKERDSQYRLWKMTGDRMGVRDIPKSFEAMVLFIKRFEQTHRGTHPRSPQLARAATDLFLSSLRIPSGLRPLAFKMVNALLDPELSKSLKIQPPPWFIRLLTVSILWCHSLTTGYLIPPSSSSAPGLLTEPPSDLPLPLRRSKSLSLPRNNQTTQPRPAPARRSLEALNLPPRSIRRFKVD